MKLEVNPRTGSLAHRVKDDFRLLSQDTRSLLHQALSDELPSARTRLMNAASGKIDEGREWLAKNSKALRNDQRLPYLVGAVGLTLLAGAAGWWLFRQSGERGGIFDRPFFSNGN
jgi:hypothetical protein